MYVSMVLHALRQIDAQGYRYLEGENGGLNDEGTRKLVTGILKQTYIDYRDAKMCPPDCPMIDTCENKKMDANYESARKFLHSGWCATLCDELNIDYTRYALHTMSKHRLSRNIYRYLESELRSYKQTCRQIEQMRQDYIMRSREPQEGHGSGPGDPTARDVEQILKDRKLQRMEQRVAAIRRVYTMCDERQKTIIEEKYWNRRYTDEGVAELLGITRRTVYNLKQKIIFALAIELNLL